MRTEGEIATNTDPTGPWSLVVPLKPLARAKSRLAPVTGPELRPRLALAFARDTVAAALSCPAVLDVVVVTDDPEARAALTALGAHVVPDEPDRGLNAALAHGEQAVRARRPRAPVAALNADLPALRPTELTRVLDYSAKFPRAFVTDAAGIGTTFLSAAPGVELRPAFGGPSRARHLDSGAVEIGLTGIDSVRQDVDTGEDLRAALALGVGAHTAGHWDVEASKATAAAARARGGEPSTTVPPDR